MKDRIFKSSISKDTWKDKYRYKNETPIQFIERLAQGGANAEKNNKEYWYSAFFDLISSNYIDSDGEIVLDGFKLTPGGRISANINTDNKKATLVNCYGTGPVKGAQIKYKRETKKRKENIKINTSNESDDLINIFLTIAEQAKTLAAEGGYGINFNFIRPRGSIINGTNIEHPGVVSYMEIWDSVANCIVKGNNDGYYDKLTNYLDTETKKAIKSPRKGAMMGVLPVWHPDIEEFVRAKTDYSKLNKFNISVMVDDKFMEAVNSGSYYDLMFNNTIYKRIDARELYDLIMESAYNTGEPGVLFYDNIKRNNPIEYIETPNATNPCFGGNEGLKTYDNSYKSFKELDGNEIKVYNEYNEIVSAKVWKTGKRKVGSIYFVPVGSTKDFEEAEKIKTDPEKQSDVYSIVLPVLNKIGNIKYNK